jgi:phage tail sheath gpL-like
MPVDVSAVARVLGITTEYKDLRGGRTLTLPQRLLVLAQGGSAGSFSTEKFVARSARDVLDAGAVAGTPAHLIARALFPDNGDGVGTVPVTFALLEDGYDAAAATGTITPTGTQTAAGQYRVVINKIKSAPFVVTAAESIASICDKIVAAINAIPDMPVVATDGTTVVNLTTKWAGLSANSVYVEMDGDALGVTYTIVQPSGGLVNPDVAAALAQMGNVWYTLVLNALNISDTDALDAIAEVGEGRWGELVRKPFVCFTGNTATSVSSATAVSSVRTTDRVNAQLVAPGSRNLPFVVAARKLARIAKVANNNPPVDYAGQKATGITPGDDGDQWDYPSRDAAVKAGSSTVEIVDGVVEMADTVTFYAPAGDPLPAYRYVNDIVKIQNIIYNIALIFEALEWKAAVLVPDAQIVVNPAARKPKAAKAAMGAMIDNLALDAIISDPKFARENTLASINGTNPRRLDVQTTVKLSGNAGIIDVGLNFGFYFGGLAAAA